MSAENEKRNSAPPAENLFSIALPQMPIAWDSTMLGLLKECPRKFELTILNGWQSPGFAAHLEFGIAYHKALEEYDIHRAAGLDHLQATIETVRFCMNYGTRNAEGQFIPYDSLFTREPTKSRDTLLRSVIWYLEHFKFDYAKTKILKTTGKPAVELSFKLGLDLINPDGGEFVLCGHLDRVVEVDHQLWITDRKAQPNTSYVLTPDGWEQIGNLKTGDLIASSHGPFVPITDLFPKGAVPVYVVNFYDGGSVKCAGDHLWEIWQPQRKEPQILNTLELEVLCRKKRSEPFIRIPKAIEHPKRDLPIHPYLLGCLLGDGYLAHHTIQFSASSWEFGNSLQAYLPDGDEIKKSAAANYTWNITGTNTRERLKTLGLFGKLSGDKFIPNDYLFASVEQRRELLRGLLDTDGTWDGKNRRYQTKSSLLGYGVVDLVRSLEGTARINRRKDGIYRVSIRLPEMEIGIPLGRYVKSVVQIGNAECTCIEVDSSDHLYVTEDYILTHNTTKGQINAKYWSQFTPNNQMSLYYAAGRIVLNEPIRGIIIDAVQIGVGYSNFARHQITRTPGMQDEWLRDTYTWIGTAMQYASEGYWPMNDKSCLPGDAVVSYKRGKNKQKTTLVELVEMYLNPHWRSAFYPLEVLADIGGKPGYVKVTGAYRKGEQPLLGIKTETKYVEVTPDHEVLTVEGWKQAQDLTLQDVLVCWKSERAKPWTNQEQVRRQGIHGIKHHPKAIIQTINGYQYKWDRDYRLVYEAHLNNMPLDRFLWLLRNDKEAAETLHYIPNGYMIHHVDGDCTNNDISNLIMITHEEHDEHHYDERVASLLNGKLLHSEVILEIEPVASKFVYDISVEAPYHNFIANGVVVHNCSNFGGCPFQPICSKDPKVRDTFLKHEGYLKRQWNPLISR